MIISRRHFAHTLSALAYSGLGRQARLEDPASLVWSLENISWAPDDPPGAKYAVLDGDRDRAGELFSYAFWLPGNVWAPVHRHSQTAHVAVLKGTLQLGFGPTADRRRTVRVPAGQFFIVRAGQLHYEGSDDECLIVGTAMGGWTTTVVG